MPRHTRTHTQTHDKQHTLENTRKTHRHYSTEYTCDTSWSYLWIKKHVISHDYLWCVILFSKSFRFFPTKKTSNTWVPHEAHRGRHIHSCSACGAATSTASRAFGWFWGFGESWHAGTGGGRSSHGNPMGILWKSHGNLLKSHGNFHGILFQNPLTLVLEFLWGI